MSLVIDPIVSPWLLLVSSLGLLVLATKFSEEIMQVLPLGLFILLLLVVGFRFELIQEQKLPPDRSIKIFQEDSRTFKFRQAQTSVEELIDTLEPDIPRSRIKRVSLQSGWETTPVFVDYEEFYSRSSPLDPIQVIVGDGRHTSPEAVPYRARRAPSHRVLFNPYSDTVPPAIKVEEPVHVQAQPGQPQWEVVVSNIDELDSARLRLKKQGKTLREKKVDTRRTEQIVRVNAPRVVEGKHYYVLELLKEDEEQLPLGHPRRRSLGFVISSVQKKALVSAPDPGWESGWWGRMIQRMNRWDVEYVYREGKQQEPGGDPDVIVYFGSPTDRLERRRFGRYLDRRKGLLFVQKGGSARTSGRVLKQLGLRTEDQPRYLRQEASIQFDVGNRSSIPSLLRYEQSLSSAPPLDAIVSSVRSGAHNRILTAGGHLLFSIHPDRPQAYLGTDRLHSLSMNWARFGFEKTAGNIAGEIIRTLYARQQTVSKAILHRDWVFAGETISLEQDKLESVEIAGPWVKQWKGENIPGELQFPVPGRYKVTTRSTGHENSAEIIVVEPRDARVTGRGDEVPNLVRENLRFRDVQSVADWIRGEWNEQKRSTRTVHFSWHHPLILIMGLILLMWTWYRRMR